MDVSIGDRNPVAILNELRPGLKYELLEQRGPSHAPIFTVAVDVDGHKYLGTGKSKKFAKCKAAEVALKSFIQFPNNCKVINNVGSNAKVDFTTDEFEIEKKECESDETKSTKKNVMPKGSVMLLNELYPSVQYECKENDGDVYARFQITINIAGDSFVGTGKFCLNYMQQFKLFLAGSSKKLAKNAAASTALTKILIKPGSANHVSSNYIISQVSSEQQELADEIGRYVLKQNIRHFFLIVVICIVPLNFGRTTSINNN